MGHSQVQHNICSMEEGRLWGRFLKSLGQSGRHNKVSLSLSAFLYLYPILNSPPHVLNKLYTILYYTTMWMVDQGEGMSQHEPAEAPPSPTAPRASTKHISDPYLLIKYNTYDLGQFSLWGKGMFLLGWTLCVWSLAFVFSFYFQAVFENLHVLVKLWKEIPYILGWGQRDSDARREQ